MKMNDEMKLFLTDLLKFIGIMILNAIFVGVLIAVIGWNGLEWNVYFFFLSLV